MVKPEAKVRWKRLWSCIHNSARVLSIKYFIPQSFLGSLLLVSHRLKKYGVKSSNAFYAPSKEADASVRPTKFDRYSVIFCSFNRQLNGAVCSLTGHIKCVWQSDCAIIIIIVQCFTNMCIVGYIFLGFYCCRNSIKVRNIFCTEKNWSSIRIIFNLDIIFRF